MLLSKQSLSMGFQLLELALSSINVLYSNKIDAGVCSLRSESVIFSFFGYSAC